MSIVYPPVETLTARQLVDLIESYGFKDPLGHPLKNCADWKELCRRLRRLKVTTLELKSVKLLGKR